MYNIEHDDGSENDNEVEKGQCYHMVKRSSCVNHLIHTLVNNMRKPVVTQAAADLKTTEKVMELLQPTRYKPSTVSGAKFPNYFKTYSG